MQIVGKNSVESHLSEWKGTCIQLSYDVTNENYLNFDVNGKQLYMYPKSSGWLSDVDLYNRVGFAKNINENNVYTKQSQNDY